MSDLKHILVDSGYKDVVTYIQSGNVIVRSEKSAQDTARHIEQILSNNFRLDSQIVRVLAIDQKAYKELVDNAPKGFGKDMDTYRYDVMFIIDETVDTVMADITVNERIDAAWSGNGVVYYRRPSLTNPNATRSHLNKIIQKPIYQLLTIRNWNTTQKLLALLEVK